MAKSLHGIVKAAESGESPFSTPTRDGCSAIRHSAADVMWVLAPGVAHERTDERTLPHVQ